MTKYLGMFLAMMGSLNKVPPTMFLMVALGDVHMFLRLYCFTSATEGEMVAHLTPAPSSRIDLGTRVEISSVQY